ncbi:FCS-Like Zinc finger 8-like [Mangifera indica]|uniref:FCS-Like Zinc finger 8-like n=1 Tax=Mangifera indica TaxID=29780 RepID=UPI001CFA980A|nr:FCS-Like Zinc finger 8-like [Mangifera indica]
MQISVLMADNGSLPSRTTEKKRKLTSFPRLFTVLTKGISETEASAMSPTSILDISSKRFSILKKPEARHKLDCKGIGLAIVDVLEDVKPDCKESKSETRMVHFGSQLKIQIPSQLGSFSSLSPAKSSAVGSVNSSLETPNSPRVFTGCLSASEMELSEDYTCVISHGPNPRTTHIFDNCIVESCCGVTGFSPLRKENNGITAAINRMNCPSENFLSFCYTCKKNLEQGKDIYIYRGDKAFCSCECRFQEMMVEEGVDQLDPV